MVGPNCFHILNFLIEISLELILYWETTNNTRPFIIFTLEHD